MEKKQDNDFFKCIYIKNPPKKILWKRGEILEEINEYYNVIHPSMSFSLCTDGSSQGISSNEDLSMQEYIEEYKEFMIFIEMLFMKLHALDIVFRMNIKNPGIWAQKTCWPSRNDMSRIVDSCLIQFISNVFFPKNILDDMKKERPSYSKIIQNKKKCLKPIIRNLEKIINKFDI